MSSIRIVIRTQKTNAAGEAPLWLRVTQHRKSHYISLGIYVNPKEWNEESQKVKKSHPNSARLNNYLARKVADCQSTVLDTELKAEQITSKKVKKAVAGITGESFIKYFESYLTVLEENKQFGTLNNATTCFHKLKKFVGKNDLLFDSINVVWLKSFQRFLLVECNNKPNTIHSSIKVIRKLFNDAVREDIISADKNPFIKFKIQRESTKKDFLSEAEMVLLETSTLIPSYEKARDVYVFAMYAGGLRVSDVLKLKVQDIKEDKIYISQQKTGDDVSVKLPNKAKEIVAKYITPEKNETSYIFPFLTEDDNQLAEKVFYKRVQSLNAYINKHLKEIAEKIGIKKKIHFHTSRHTFATLALKKGIRLEYVSKLMGHNSIKTTQIYAKIVNEELDKAMMEAFD
ncbi:MAG: site-specific integrase [Cytophagales bacterium]|nr:site-specific integrase [Cytophagales bacterium]